MSYAASINVVYHFVCEYLKRGKIDDGVCLKATAAQLAKSSNQGKILLCIWLLSYSNIAPSLQPQASSSQPATVEIAGIK